MSETPKFIALVEQHDCIWKKSFKNNVEKRCQAWDDIAENMYGNSWRGFSVAEKTSAKTDLQKKWKNVKDCFIKELKNQQHELSGASRQKKSKYMFFDHLMFLLPEMDNRSRRFNSSNNSLDNSPYFNETDNYQPKEDSNSETANFDTYDNPNFQKEIEPSSPRLSSSIGRHRQTKGKLTSVQFRTRLLRILSAQQNQKPNCQHDEDESFFNSLLPTVRKMEENQKIQFRMEVLNSLRNIRSGNNSNIAHHSMSIGNFAPGQQFFPVSPHQLQVYSLPAAHPELSSTSGDGSHQNATVVSNTTQLEQVAISNELVANNGKNRNVEVYSNVL